MKLSKILHLVAVTALVASSAVGCRKGLQKPTPLPGQPHATFTDESPKPLIDTTPKTADTGTVPPIDLSQPPTTSANVPPGGNGLNTGGPTSAPIPKPADGNPAGNIPVGDLSAWTPAAEQPFRSDTVFFDFDKSNVRPSEIPKLQRVANAMKNYQGKALRVEGHCDERGTEEYNRALGERRALSIREHLVRLGVDATRIDTISYGEDRPAVPGHDESAFTQNRRGEFILLNPPGSP